MSLKTCSVRLHVIWSKTCSLKKMFLSTEPARVLAKEFAKLVFGLCGIVANSTTSKWTAEHVRQFRTGMKCWSQWNVQQTMFFWSIYDWHFRCCCISDGMPRLLSIQSKGVYRIDVFQLTELHLPLPVVEHPASRWGSLIGTGGGQRENKVSTFGVWRSRRKRFIQWSPNQFTKQEIHVRSGSIDPGMLHSMVCPKSGPVHHVMAIFFGYNRQLKCTMSHKILITPTFCNRPQTWHCKKQPGD